MIKHAQGSMTGADLQPISEVLADVRHTLTAVESGAARWGNWRHDPETGAFIFYDAEGEEMYDIGPPPSGAEAQWFAKWLAQLAEKSWATSADLGDFVRMIAEVMPLGEIAHRSADAPDVVTIVRDLQASIRGAAANPPG